MGNLYRTSEIETILAEKTENEIRSIVNDKDLTDGQVITAIHQIRAFQSYANTIIKDLKALDEKYDAEMAAWRAKQEAEKNAAAT